VSTVRTSPEKSRIRDLLMRADGAEGCPFCRDDANGATVLAEEDRYGLPVTTACCDQCGAVFLDPMPTADTLALLYDAAYADLHRDGGPTPRLAERETQRAQRMHAMIDDHITDGMRILDVGAAMGGMLASLRSRHRELDVKLVAVEPDARFTAAIHDHDADIEVHTGRFEDLDADGSFDLILFVHVFEHLADPMGVLAQLWGMLRPDGLTYIETPNAFRADVAPDLESFLLFSKLVNYHPSLLRHVFTRRGFNVLHHDTTSDKHQTALFQRCATPTTIVDETTLRDDADRLRRYLQSMPRKAE